MKNWRFLPFAKKHFSSISTDQCWKPNKDGVTVTATAPQPQVDYENLLELDEAFQTGRDILIIGGGMSSFVLERRGWILV